MNIELNEAIKAVDELNDLLPINSEQFFTINYSSYWTSVSFGDIRLWDSENDDREFNENKNEYEPFMSFLKKQLGNKVEELNYLNAHIQ